ncbi:glycosyltransferase [Luteitalea sp.]|jgi:hypothetical protein|uniref:CgeB family protein n=1 Tax=Luteitalea sp. TaxID=2004800 RepID=UPI0037CB7D6B
MKVLVSIRQRSFARFVAFDLAEAARRLGHVVHWVDFDALHQAIAPDSAEAHRDILARVAEDVRAFAPDLVLSYGIEAIVPPYTTELPGDAWTLADAARAPVACFFYDFGAPFDRPVDAATAPWIARAQRADVRVFCWDRQAVADLHRFGVAAEYLPMAVNEAMFFPPAEDGGRDVSVVFSGGPTPERQAALREVAPQGLAIYGYDEAIWTADPALAGCYRGFVPERDRLREIYQRARVTLNVTRAHGRASLNMRVFEAMACGCVVVTDQAEEASTIFTPGEHLVVIDRDESPAAVVARVLGNEATRAAIGARGAACVRESHTYVERLSTITPQLKALVSESRAWAFWDSFLEADPDKALRFLGVLRAERTLLREDLWHMAEATAHARRGRRALALRACREAQRRNPALVGLDRLAADLQTH